VIYGRPLSHVFFIIFVEIIVTLSSNLKFTETISHVL